MAAETQQQQQLCEGHPTCGPLAVCLVSILTALLIFVSIKLPTVKFNHL